jgi:hypothetical protein
VRMTDTRRLATKDRQAPSAKTETRASEMQCSDYF